MPAPLQSNGDTALHIAARRGYGDLTMLLQDAGGSMTAKNKVRTCARPTPTRAAFCDPREQQSRGPFAFSMQAGKAPLHLRPDESPEIKLRRKRISTAVSGKDYTGRAAALIFLSSSIFRSLYL